MRWQACFGRGESCHRHLKQPRHPLNLVQNHQPPGLSAEILRWVCKTGGVVGILQVEVQAVRRIGGDVPSERGLANLPRP